MKRCSNWWGVYRCVRKASHRGLCHAWEGEERKTWRPEALKPRDDWDIWMPGRSYLEEVERALGMMDGASVRVQPDHVAI